AGPYAGLTSDERRQLVADTFLPRPKRSMDSSQYTLDAKLDFAVCEQHHFIVGGQAIDGDLEDGVFGLEGGGEGNGTAQEHKMWSLLAQDNWSPPEPLTFTLGLRHDGHNVFGSQLSPRAYAVW